jgi:3-hydroxyisobutyrate dehydrogenase
MGASMVSHLLAAGYSATVYNRSRAKAEPLAAKGAIVAASPAEVAANSDVVFSIVGYPDDVREVRAPRRARVAGSETAAIIRGLWLYCGAVCGSWALSWCVAAAAAKR